MKITKDTGISVGALVILFGVFSWVTDKIETKADKEEVKEVEVKVEKTKDELVERKLIDKEQSIHIKQMQQNQRLFIKEFKELQQAK